ncbi:hypothetical protein [Niabella hibiscisoli]|uniref:hypothetical protein n=1 Tax=Niabella hibiscisoli TaxID=1825928 RepID=UPI001F1034A3|nr:hypothetical protein [Niabella hibiscisoli]MCH5719271.1 hypothetical protein [Niabella hibiscisoli]
MPATSIQCCRCTNPDQAVFFHQICNQPEGKGLALGGILCCWPDTRVDNKNNILKHNPVWPGMIAYSEAIWCGRQNASIFEDLTPEYGTMEWKYFREFENRLANHRDRFLRTKRFHFRNLATCSGK